MLIDNSNPNLVKRTKYPIFFCTVHGRIISQVKPTKSRRKPKPKERLFTIDAPIKFENDGETVISNRLISLRDKYTYNKEDKIVFDKVNKIKYLGYTHIRD